MKKKLRLILAIITINLAGCADVGYYKDFFILHETKIEALEAKFSEDRAKFLNEFVIDDVHVRFKVAHFFDNVSVYAVYCKANGIYRITDVYGNKHVVTTGIDVNNVIFNFTFYSRSVI